jgi:hypothetical protein
VPSWSGLAYMGAMHHRARPFYPFPAARSTSECENSPGPAGAGRSGKKISCFLMSHNRGEGKGMFAK